MDLKKILFLAIAFPSLAWSLRGGKETEAYEYHDKAAGAVIIQDQKKRLSMCSGTLIARRVFLTAAHCVPKDPLNTYVVFSRRPYQDFLSSRNKKYPWIVKAKKPISHPDYSLVSCPANMGPRCKIQEAMKIASADLAVVILKSDPPAIIKPVPVVDLQKNFLYFREFKFLGFGFSQLRSRKITDKVVSDMRLRETNFLFFREIGQLSDLRSYLSEALDLRGPVFFAQVSDRQSIAIGDSGGGALVSSTDGIQYVMGVASSRLYLDSQLIFAPFANLLDARLNEWVLEQVNNLEK